MLSHDDLKPHYGKATWLFVTRNFENDEKDREAARTHDRFGITSWPHCVLFDPRDDRVLANLPRNLRGFVAAMDRHEKAVPAAGSAARSAAATIERAIALREAGKTRESRRLLDRVAAKRDDAGIWLHARELRREWQTGEPDLAELLDDPDVRQRAIAVEAIASLPPGKQTRFGKRAREILLDADEHLIVRRRALALVAELDPKPIIEHANDLLVVDNDPFRFAVLEVLAQRPRPELTPLLVRLFEGAGAAVPSSNPNVLRIHVAKCLGACGDERAVDALAEVARRADVRNGLTGTAVDALAAIGERGDVALRRRVVQELRRSFPIALEDARDDLGQRAERMLLYSCKRVCIALTAVAESVPEPPKSWSRRDREEFLASLKSVRARR